VELRVRSNAGSLKESLAWRDRWFRSASGALLGQVISGWSRQTHLRWPGLRCALSTPPGTIL